MNILFVCKGNICRSPMAEAIFNSKNCGITAHSAASTRNTKGQRTKLEVLAVLKKYGIRAELKHTCFQNDLATDWDKVFNLDELGIHDPYYDGDYERTYVELEHLINVIIRNLI